MSSDPVWSSATAAQPAAPSRILVTRPLPAALRTDARLRALGWPTVLAPMLRIVALDAALPEPAAIQAILVTSANALPGLPPGLHGKTLLAVGSATAARAREIGFADSHAAEGNAAALAALAARHCNPAGLPVLIAHGAGQADALAARLEADGFAIRRAAVYETRPAAALPHQAVQAWQAAGLQAALFYSAQSAEAFVRLVLGADLAAAAAHVLAIAIAAPVAQALSPLPWRAVRVALRPDQEAMLALLP